MRQKETVVTLADGTVDLFFVPLYFSAAGAAQLFVPQGQQIFGARTHFRVVQLHFTNVQFITAGCRVRKLFSIHLFRLNIKTTGN